MDSRFEANGQVYAGYDGPLFKSMELRDYRLLPAFPGSKSRMKLPDKIAKLLGRPENQEVNVGAYSPAP